VQFYVVYIQEAHPSDGWQTETNRQEGVIYKQPSTMDERVDIANACALRFEISIPTLVDGIANGVEEAYAALPDRLYLVDGEGSIVYRSERGPRGFNPDEFEDAITSHLS
jgi:hypothetical protein